MMYPHRRSQQLVILLESCASLGLTHVKACTNVKVCTLASVTHFMAPISLMQVAR